MKRFGMVMMVWALGVAGVAWASAGLDAGAERVTEQACPARLAPLFSGSYPERCRLLRGLGEALSAAEVDALLAFIVATPESVGLDRAHFNSVADKAVIALERQVAVPSAFVEALAGMAVAEGGDPTWRDYCVQHLGVLYATATSAERDRIWVVWTDALAADSGMAGTVVLALRRNIGAPGVEAARVAELAGGVALDERQSDPARLTALLAAAELGHAEMLPLAREIAVSRRSTSLRMAALATMGMLGDGSDRGLLERYAGSSDMRLRTAARAALENIAARLTR